MQLFKAGKPFFKGNTHCHTTLSDGKLPPREVKQLYREKGYDFLALTDHRRLGEATHMEDGMLILSGAEMDYTLPGEVIHLIGIGMNETFEECGIPADAQTCIDLYRQHGGRAILAHPAWSLNTLPTLQSLQGVTATEIYNSVSTYPWNGDRADSSNLLDIAAAHGIMFHFVAADDSHYYQSEAGRAWTMVQADELSQESLFEALDAGRFYCTQGPEIHQITLEDGLLTVECSRANHVIFYSNLPWAAGRCVSGHGLTAATYDLSNHKGETFVRVQVIDNQGNSAWSNPIQL